MAYPPVNEAPGYQLTPGERQDAYIRKLVDAVEALADAHKLLPATLHADESLSKLRGELDNLIAAAE